MTLACWSCGGLLEVGEALLVRPAGQAPSFLVHRPMLDPRCIQRVAGRDAFPITLLDDAAVREYDRRQAGARP